MFYFAAGQRETHGAKFDDAAADGEFPTRLHFLSVSYITVRMFT